MVHTQSEYIFTRNVISGGRVTVPKVVLDEWGLSSGDKIVVVFKKIQKNLNGIVI